VLCSVVLSLPAWAGPRPSLPEREPRCMSRGVGLDSRCLVNGVNLHFVDWGGTGDDLVLVAGLDDLTAVAMAEAIQRATLSFGGGRRSDDTVALVMKVPRCLGVEPVPFRMFRR